MKTILVGSLPPPLTGQTIAFQMAWEGLQDNKIPSQVIDLSGGGHLTLEGSFSIQRLSHLLKPFCKALVLLFGRKILYLSATQNWMGFLRDSVFILLASAGRQRIVLHAHWGNFAGFYASLGPLQRYLVRRVLRRVDTILVLGENHRAMFDFEPALGRKIEVVYNGLPYCKGETPLKPKRLPCSRPKLLFLSNLVLSKGYLQVLEALRILVHELGIDAECHFCGSFVLESGESPYSTIEDAQSDFLLRIRQSGLTGSAHWHGPVDGNSKLRLLQQSHFFILPTRLLEGQPMSIIEALAFGLVVITTRTPGIDEMVEGGKFAELTPFEQPHQISRVIESYIVDPGRFEAMSRASIERYLATFTREQHLRRLIPLILG